MKAARVRRRCEVIAASPWKHCFQTHLRRPHQTTGLVECAANRRHPLRRKAAANLVIPARTSTTPPQVTELLAAWRAGNSSALDQLVPLSRRRSFASLRADISDVSVRDMSFRRRRS